MAELTTLSELKIHMGISGSDEDTLLTQLLDNVEQTIFSYTGRESFASAAATEYFDGTGREILILERYPVTAVASLYVDNGGYYGNGTSPFGSGTEWTEGTDFTLKRTDESEKNRGLVLALGAVDFEDVPGIWPRGRGNVKVTYTAGYTTIPDDLQLATHLLTASVYAIAEKNLAGPVGGETFGKYSYTLLGNPSMAGMNMLTVRSILAKYKKLEL